MLSPNEKPARIVKLRMQQAGYDDDDGMQLLGPESLSILVRFYYPTRLLAVVRHSYFCMLNLVIDCLLY